MKINETFKKNIMVVLLISVLCVMSSVCVLASEDVKVRVQSYESEATTKFDASNNSKTKEFSYGQEYLGRFSLNGNIGYGAEKNGVPAFEVSGDVAFSYLYGGEYHDDKTQWNIKEMPITDLNDEVADTKVSGLLGSGVILIQKSEDKKEWINLTDPVKDVFDDSNKDAPVVYTTLSEDVDAGMFFRVVAAYRMSKKRENAGIFEKKEDAKNFVEIYEFYLCRGTDAVELKDIASRKKLVVAAQSDKGFYIDRNNSTNSVQVKQPDGTVTSGNKYYCFDKPGTYTVTITSELGQKKELKTEVALGTEWKKLTTKLYESKKDSGFLSEEQVKAQTSFGTSLYTALYIGQNAGYGFVEAKKDDTAVYGINGQSVDLYLELRYPLEEFGNQCEVVYDKWGKKEKEQIRGIHVGQIGAGALIVQSSEDGKTWTRVETESYSNGLTTTDFGNYFPNGQKIRIYSPDGESIQKGMYIRVMYAYQVKKHEKNDYIDCLEQYDFYLCSDNLDAVVFHNLSISKTDADEFGEMNENQVQIRQKTETLISGSMTVTGFQIDNSLNPTVQYSVRKDDQIIPVPKSGKLEDPGKYEIVLISAAGTAKTTTIYVDRFDTDEAVSCYFGNGFIDGKRIYSEGKYPVYEGGETKYLIQGVAANVQPIGGTIKNMTTGSEIEIEATRTAKQGMLTEPGTYEVKLETKNEQNREKEAGDKRVFTYHFELIAQGTAPGPQVNKRTLEEYAHKNVSDAYPVYYGKTVKSAHRGYITVAFETKEEALKYASKYEAGLVEKQGNGASNKYNGQGSVLQKDEYDSNWELMSAVNASADASVERLYFDLSDESTYRTVDDSVLNNVKNQETQEYEKSVVIFGDGQKEKLTDHNTLPIIGKKPYSKYVSASKLVKGFDDFQFVRDERGYDSYAVSITDINDKKYSIEYEKGVWEQLNKQGCPSGRITITEETVYGDSNSYNALFIAEGENATQLKVTVYQGETQNEKTVTQSDCELPSTVNAFSINDVVDELDPYALVIVKKGQEEIFNTADKWMPKTWAVPGDYTIKVVNRLGYGYSITLSVAGMERGVISFQGEGTENISDIITTKEMKRVALPELERYGYEFNGYADEDGERYFDEITDFEDNRVFLLKPVWNPKKVDVVLKNEDNSVISSTSVDFGSKFVLPTPTVKDGYEFEGWTRNGNLIKEQEIIIGTEDTIVLTASTKELEIIQEPVTEETTETGGSVEQNTEDIPANPDQKKERKFPWALVGVLAVVAGAGIVLKKRYFPKNKKQE